MINCNNFLNSKVKNSQRWYFVWENLSPFRGLLQGFLHPILYFQPSPSQSDLRHFRLFNHSIYTASATVLSRHFLPTGVFYVMLLPNILAQPAFIKASLGASSSSLKFAGLHADLRNTDPAHLYV